MCVCVHRICVLCTVMPSVLTLLYLDEPGFYSANWLYIGKCFIKLKNKPKAREWLQRVLDEGGSHDDDKDVSERCCKWNVECGIQLHV